MLVAACAVLGAGVGWLLEAVVVTVPVRAPVRPELRRRLPFWRAAPSASGEGTRQKEWALAVATAAGFGGMAAAFGSAAELPAFLVLTAALIAVAVIDIRHLIVPNRIVVATLAVAVPLLAVAAAVDGEWGRLGRAAVGAVLASAALLAMNLASPRAMGMGDVKLAVVLGLFLGWRSLGHVAVGLFLGFLAGAVVGVALIATGRRGRRDHIPFAPFLAVGAYAAVVAGQSLLDWYSG